MLPSCTGNCDQGRGRCDCMPVPAEACTELGADDCKDPTMIQKIKDLILAIFIVLIIALLAFSAEFIK